MTDQRAELRRLVVARRDLGADLAEMRLRLLDAEQTGTDAADLVRHVGALEARDAELAYATRVLRAEIAAVEAQAEPELLTPFMAG